MTLTLEIRPELEAQLNQEATSLGIALPELVNNVLEQHMPPKPAFESAADYISRLAERARAGVPQEELDKIPTDLSENLDHYLYGAPKVTD